MILESVRHDGSCAVNQREFLKPTGTALTAFPQHIGIGFTRLNEIVNRKRGITADTAFRFSKAGGISPDFWLNLQRMAEMDAAMHSPNAAEIAKIQPFTREAVGA